MKATRHSVSSLPSRLVGRWNELLEASPVRSAFLSYQFCAAVEKVRGGVFVLHIENGGGEEGFLPFQVRSGRALLGHAEKVGGSLSDYFGIVGVFRGPLDGDELLHAAHLSSLRFDHAVPELCPFRFSDAKIGQGVCVHVKDFCEYTGMLAEANKSFFNEIRRTEKLIRAELGNIRFEWRTARPAELDRLILTKRDQYHRTGVTDALSAQWRRALLHQLFAQAADSRCEAVLSTMYSDDTWIASSLGLICQDTFHVWFPAYNQTCRRYGPGHLLFFKIIERACDHGIHLFDFGEGVSQYKSEYRGQVYEVRKGVLSQRSFAGQAERVLQSLEWRFEKWSRREAPPRKPAPRSPLQPSRKSG